MEYTRFKSILYSASRLSINALKKATSSTPVPAGPKMFQWRIPKKSNVPFGITVKNPAVSAIGLKLAYTACPNASDEYPCKLNNNGEGVSSEYAVGTYNR